MAGTVERTLALKLIADVGDLGKGLKGAERRLGGTAKAFAKWGKAFAGAAILGGLEKLATSVVDGVAAFREEQQAVRNFTQTAKRMRVPTRQAADALDRMADRAVNLGFDDGDMIRGMDAFVRKTGDIEKATRLNALAMDIARAKGIDLAAAQKQVDQIYNGSARVLKAYGIEGKKGMEAVDAARRVERGKAAAWAKNHPMEVLAGKISDSWADVVGNLARGNLGGALAAGQKLARQLTRGIFGWTDKEGKRHKGLWDRLFDATPDKQGKPRGIVNRLGQDIADEVGKVDWGKSLSGALTTALDGLKAGVESGGIAQVAAVGGAIATAMFGVSLFIDAAMAMLKAPGWLTNKALAAAISVAAVPVGKAFAVAAFVAETFVGVLKGMFNGLTETDGWAAFKGVVEGVGTKVGTALQVGLVAGLTAGLILLIGDELRKALTGALEGLGLGGVSDLLNLNPIQHQPPRSDRRKGFARGTAGTAGGWSWVGERGPELLRLPTGTQVLNNRRSMAAAGGTNVFNFTVNVPPTADQATIGATIMRAIDAALGSGYRFRNPVKGPA